MSTLLIIILIILLLGGGGSYYGYRTWGHGPGVGIFGVVLLVLILFLLFGHTHVRL